MNNATNNQDPVPVAGTQEKTPGFNHKIPEPIMTPDTVKTRIGTLNFVDGGLTYKTTKKVFDPLDFLRGIEVFLNFIPATSKVNDLIAMRFMTWGCWSGNSYLIYRS